MLGFWGTLERPITALAPMENVTDTVFRRFVAACGGPTVFFTEFTNMDWLFSKRRDTVIHRLEFTEVERPLVAQIWGLDPENYYRGAQLIREMGFDGIDINMGCPAPKLRHKATCSGLIDQPQRASELIRATQEGAGDLPVSVKTRLGVRERKTESWATFLLEHNIAALTMHVRTAKDMSNVPADWSEMHTIVAIRDALQLDTLILGNGDVTSLTEIHEKTEEYKVDGVMVGRGIFQDPYLFHPERSLKELDAEQRVALMLEHTHLFLDVWGDTKDFNIMKKFFKVYMSDFEGALPLREALMKQSCIEGVLDTLQEHGMSVSPHTTRGL